MDKIRLYHGSKNLFEKFDFSKIGSNATSEGIGFYMTDSIDVAQAYSENDIILFTDFDLKTLKFHNFNKKYFTRNSLKRFLLKLHILQGYENSFLWNYEDLESYGIDKAINTCIELHQDCESDADILGSLICGGAGVKDVNSLYNDFFKIDGFESIGYSNKGDGSFKVYVFLNNNFLLEKLIKI